jgi:membrane fusion protein
VAAPSYRAEVREERARAALGTIVLIRPLSLVALTAAALVIVVAIVSYLTFAEYAKKASLSGALVPASGSIRIVAPHSGMVRERRVREGERVAAGQALLRLVDARSTLDDGPVGAAMLGHAQRRLLDTRRQREETVAAAAGEKRALLDRIASIDTEAVQLDREMATLAARERLARDSLERFETLEQRGFVSAAQRQQREEEALEQRSRRHAVERARLAMTRERTSLQAAMREADARLRVQLAALDAQLAQLAQEQVERRALADATVVAPAAGTVSALLVETGQLVGGGASLLTLLPEGSPLEAHLYAPSRAIGFIRAGQDVLLRYPAFPYQKFGSHRARVVSVSRSALAPAELGFVPPDGAREPLYRIKVALANQTVAAYGRAEPLQAGMEVQADVLLDRRRLIEWVFEPLLSLAGRA